MEKIAINPKRLQWCMDISNTAIDELSERIHIGEKTLLQAMEQQAVLSVNQLKKIANYFKRGLLFFLDPNEVLEERIYSPQFRTINNKKPIHSYKLRVLIELVEKQRLVYKSLLEDLDEPAKSNWLPEFELNTQDIKQASANVRQWLNLPDEYEFNDLRQAVENKGIMVFVFSGYKGQWQIDKEEPVRGFSLCYEVLPVIVIKKQASKGAQAFTLMHELAHLLLHQESTLDNEEDLNNYQGREKDANEFAGNLLIPDHFLEEIKINKLLDLEVEKYDDYLATFKKRWCVSGEAILVRLLINDKIHQERYKNYKDFRKKQNETSIKNTTIIPRKNRHREPVNMFGRPFVYTVFDSLRNQHITLAKASTYLDNLKISDVHKLEEYV